MKLFENYFEHLSTTSTVIGLTDELKMRYLYERFIQDEKSCLLVCNSLFEANKLYQTIQNYTKDTLLFPMDDFLTSEALAVSPELKATRLETLTNLLTDKPYIVITNLMGYLRYLPTKKVFHDHFISFTVNKDYAMDKLISTLYQMGYRRETIVNKTGEMAVRGFVIDVFPIEAENPIRIELWGDTIDSIRTFDVNTQLTLNTLTSITVAPNTEFLIAGEDDTFTEVHRDLPKYGSVASLLDYLDHGRTYFYHYSDIQVGYRQLVEEMMEYSISEERDSQTTYMHDFEKLNPKHPFYFMNFDNTLDCVKNTETYTSRDLDLFSGSPDQIRMRLEDYLHQKNIVVVALSNRYKVNKVLEEFHSDEFLFTTEQELVPDKINLIVKNLASGFILGNWIVVSERELFHKNDATIHYKTNFKFGTKIRDITKLNPGDYIVHHIHGIGRYLGMKTLLKNGMDKDYLMVEYKGGDKLYIPVEKIEFISKYSSNDGAAPKLNKLGGIEWEKTKLRVRSKIENIAGELLKLYAERENAPGFAFPEDEENQLAFEKEFPYQETVDQLKVVEEIKQDMMKAHPMDRLLCGDVGYGKTEVAFRAIFKAILAGKQVALLCPTTILSQQHYSNACNRFSSFPINIAILNRFVTAKEVKNTLQKLEAGKIDLIIGTHRILSEDVKFKDLGLLVIDEEQRFGVKHKEKIKQYKHNVDVLTLSATPIPRTLQMSMTGIRGLSLIETPPVDRYPIQTYVLAENNQIIKDAIYKELSRNGQVFLLYNHIDDMVTKVKEIEKLIPDARIIYAHGRMDKTELENVMIQFMNHEYDILICTTIIETGIDIPRVNTLIIMDADRFGLSQLYQIRGRVGRSNKIAYCYLMYDKHKILSEIAIKRLKVIKDFTELGSGFAIAMRDLALRGAGDILGSEQAGFVDSVGIELFLNMLQDEIRRLKGEPVKEEIKEDTQPLLDVATSISDTYVQEEELKLSIHKKINEIDSYDKLKEVKDELEDRFGKLDEMVLIYMYEEWFEKLAAKFHIKNVKQTKTSVEILLPLDLTNQVNGQLLFIEASRLSRMFRFKMVGKCLAITLDTVKLEKHFIYYLIQLMEIIEKAMQ